MQKKNMVEATNIFVVTVQSTNIAEEKDSKPRTVSFQGEEDDTTSFNYNRTNDNDYVQAANQNHVFAAPLVTVGDVVVPSYLESSFGDELVIVTCIHADLPRKIVVVRPKEEVLFVVPKNAMSVSMYIDFGCLGTHAHVKNIGDSNYRKRSDPFKMNRSRIKLCLLFLFLPRKEYQASRRTCCMWSLLCLKEIGWGPPTEE